MTSLLIRIVDVGVQARLEARATANHRSLEEETLETLRLAVADDPGPEQSVDIVALFTQQFGLRNGVELELPLLDRNEGDRPAPDFSDPGFSF